MPERIVSTSLKAQIISAEPQLFVADIKTSCDFFVEKLGFAVAFTYGTPPFYAQVKRDGAAVNLRHVDEPVIDVALRQREQLLSVSFTVAAAADIEALCAEFQSNSATFFQPLKTQPWGTRDFIVQDPDGNLLLFAAPLSATASTP